MERDPTLEDLMAYAAGELPDAEAADVASHCSVNADAAEIVAGIRELRSTLAADDSVAPPEGVASRAKAIFEPRRVPARPGASDALEGLAAGVRAVVARLVFDSRAAGLAGVRGAGGAVQTAYAAGDVEIDLEIAPAESADERRLTGQIDAPDGTRIEAVLAVGAGDDDARAEARPDAHGLFELRLAPGRYDLLVRLGDGAVRLPDVEIA